MKTFNEVKLGLTTATYGNSLGSNIGKDYEHLKYFLEKRMLSLDKALDSYKSNMDELNAAMLQKSHSLGASHVATIDEKDKEILKNAPPTESDKYSYSFSGSIIIQSTPCIKYLKISNLIA